MNNILSFIKYTVFTNNKRIYFILNYAFERNDSKKAIF